MANRTFKRDQRGRFATSESRSGGKMSKAQKAAKASADELARLKAGRRSEQLQAAVDSAEAAVKAAEKEWKKAQRDGGDAELESAWDQRLKAHSALAKALKRSAESGLQ